MYLELELPQSLNKRHGLNISHCTSKFDNTDIRRAIPAINRHLGNPLNPVLDGIGDMGDNLYCLAKIVASPLPLNNALLKVRMGWLHF